MYIHWVKFTELEGPVLGKQLLWLCVTSPIRERTDEPWLSAKIVNCLVPAALLGMVDFWDYHSDDWCLTRRWHQLRRHWHHVPIRWSLLYGPSRPARYVLQPSVAMQEILKMQICLRSPAQYTQYSIAWSWQYLLNTGASAFACIWTRITSSWLAGEFGISDTDSDTKTVCLLAASITRPYRGTCWASILHRCCVNKGVKWIRKRSAIYCQESSQGSLVNWVLHPINHQSHGVHFPSSARIPPHRRHRSGWAHSCHSSNHVSDDHLWWK